MNDVLFYGVRQDNAELVSRALNLGASANALDHSGFGRTALDCAAWRGNVAAMTVLLDAGASTAVFGEDGCVVLHRAVMCGQFAAMRKLIDAGADVDVGNAIDGCTALHYAARSGYTIAAAMLLEAGANRAAQDIDGETALDVAIGRKYSDIISLLRNHA